MKKIQGILPALVTPLREDETLNVPVLHQLINDQLAGGAQGFYVGGATGEGIALRREVREELAEESVKAVNHRSPCIVHIASADFAEAVALAKHAEACGADMISAIPPIFFQYDEDDVFHYYKKLCEAVSIPMMIYYNPAAGFPMTAAFAARVFEIDNVTAIKWTSPNFYQLASLKDMTHGEMTVINGPDEMMLSGLSAGADGAIGTTYNIQLDAALGVYNSFTKGDIAEAWAQQCRINRVVDVLKNYVTIPFTKVILEKQGYAVGNCVFPMKRYSEKEKDMMYAAYLAARA